MKREKLKQKLLGTALIVMANLVEQEARGQDGNAGITQATDMVKSYFDTGTDLMYAVGALLGLIGE